MARPKKRKTYEQLTKQEKEKIYMEYEAYGKNLTIQEFADKVSIVPVAMSQLLRIYKSQNWEQVITELKNILTADAEIVKRTQDMVREYLTQLEKTKTRNKINEKEIETLLKIADTSLKRSTLITKTIDEKKNKTTWKESAIKVEFKM